MQVGTKLGVFEVLAKIGEGGMGEVYRARDTRLGRDVAIKVLPSQFALDPERVARLTREAQVLAALNHPNVAAIYGFEEAALVLEYVDGPTLADRIARGALPLDEAVPIARQIADALEAAHDQQIIHRDLKPANVKLRPDGTVKVLDFGLAKLLPGPADSDYSEGHKNLTVSPTITTPAMTMAGVILGTAAYMSPEQAKGRAADKRSDLWAFGCVVFEMLTGKRPFDGADVSDTLAAVLRAEPDWTALPTHTPRAIRTLLRRCLEKDRKRRLADASDARLELDEVGVESAASLVSPAPAKTSFTHRAVPIAIGMVIAIAFTSAAWWISRPATATPIVTRFTIPLADDEQAAAYPFRAIAISPDGRQLAWASNLHLNIRSMGSVTPAVVAGTDHGFAIGTPAFSPDGKAIVYATLGERDRGPVLRTISASGGVPTVVAEPEINGISGLSWSDAGILYTDSHGITRVSPGGKPEVVVPLIQGETIQGVSALPGGAGILFAVAQGRDPGVAPTIDLWDGATIVVQPPTGERKTLISGGSDPRYLSSGHLLYARGGTLFAAPFDLKRLAVSGTGVPVLQGVARSILGRTSSGFAQADVSATGSLIYAPGPVSPAAERPRLMVVDRAGNVTELKVQPGFYERPRVSPDGTQLALGSEDSSGNTIWIHDLSRDTSMRQLTFEGRNRFPVWSPDGTYVAFQSDREGDPAIFRQRSDGSSKAERLTTPDKGTAHVPESWSSDGKSLAYSVVKATSNTLWVYSLDSKKSMQVPDVETPRLPSPSFSPDGRWIAYSLPIGIGQNQNQVLVQPFPPTGAKHLVGTGARPLWSRNGKEIFYYRNDNTFFKTVIANQTALTVSSESALPFNVLLGRGPGAGRDADIMPDDKRFVAVVVPSATSTGAVGIRRFEVIANWFEELRQRTPTN
jgi:eukaryotic-like serine/threonine-protein kinase